MTQTPSSMVHWLPQFTARVHLTFVEHGEGRLRSFTFDESCERRVPMSMDGVEGLRWICRYGDGGNRVGVAWVDEADWRGLANRTDRTDRADRTDRTDRTERADGVDRCPGPRAMLWAGIGRSYRTRVVWGGCVPRAMLWAGIRCPVGTRGEGRGVESLGGAGPAGWLRESGSRLPQSKAFGWLILGGLYGGCLSRGFRRRLGRLVGWVWGRNAVGIVWRRI